MKPREAEVRVWKEKELLGDSDTATIGEVVERTPLWPLIIPKDLIKETPSTFIHRDSEEYNLLHRALARAARDCTTTKQFLL